MHPSRGVRPVPGMGAPARQAQTPDGRVEMHEPQTQDPQARSYPQPQYPSRSQAWNDVARMIGDVVVDRENHRIGKVQDVAQRADTMEPTWLVVKTSLFGRPRLVPVGVAEVHDHVVHLPYRKDQVLDAPVPAVPVTVAASEDARLIDHYRLAA